MHQTQTQVGLSGSDREVNQDTQPLSPEHPHL